MKREIKQGLADFLAAENLKQVWQVYQKLFRIILAVTHNWLQFKGTEAEFKGTEWAEFMKFEIANFNPNSYLPFFLLHLAYIKKPWSSWEV